MLDSLPPTSLEFIGAGLKTDEPSLFVVDGLTKRVQNVDSMLLTERERSDPSHFVRVAVRERFRKANQPYHIPNGRDLMGHIMVRPLDDKHGQPIFWWNNQI